LHGGVPDPAVKRGGLASVAVLLFAGWAALSPQPMAWVYIAVVALFELWLARRVAAVAAGPVMPGEAPYHFSAEEARLVQRYRFYFTYPVIARASSSVLAAIGLTALGLAPWLTYKLDFLPAALIGLNLFAVARYTRLLAPLMALRLAASRGEREALELLSAHDPAWAKIRAGNEPRA
jgi:hypothetical protein